MQTDIFFNHFQKNFLVNCVPERLILLIFDGHSTHLSSQTIQLAIDNNVTILKLPSHSSNLLQPLDVSVYKSVKSRWDEKLTAFQRQHIGVKIPKKEFSILVGAVWRETTPNIIVQGFRKTGIFPFDKEAVDKSKFDPEALKRYENRSTENIDSPSLPQPGPSGIQQGPEPSGMQQGPELTEIQEETCPVRIAQQEPVSSGQNTPRNKTNDERISFEDILLEKIRQTPIVKKTTKREIVPGAKVVTEPESKKILDEKEKEFQRKKLLVKKKKPGIGNDRIRGKLMLKKKSIPSSKTKSNKKQKKRKVNIYEDSDESEEVIISNSEDDFENLTVDDLAKCLSEEEKEEEHEDGFQGGLLDYKVGDFVLISLPGKVNIKHFVGQILEFSENEPVIKFARKRSGPGSVFVWPEQEDVSVITIDHLLVRLPQPTVGRREELIFKVSFSTYNIQ